MTAARPSSKSLPELAIVLRSVLPALPPWSKSTLVFERAHPPHNIVWDVWRFGPLTCPHRRRIWWRSIVQLAWFGHFLSDGPTFARRIHQMTDFDSCPFIHRNHGCSDHVYVEHFVNGRPRKESPD
jgi:hypothetical protein